MTEIVVFNGLVFPFSSESPPTSPQFIFGNFFSTELTTGVSVSATVLSVPPSATLNLPVISAGQQARLTLWDGVLPPEIVGCYINAQTGTLTVERALEGTTAQAWGAGTQVQSTITAEIINAALSAYFNFQSVLAASFLKLIGGTLTGPLTLSADPTTPLGAATKQYVDNIQGNKLPLAGGTMSGAINMNNNRILSLPTPTSSSEPTTKTYVDDLGVITTKLLADQAGGLVTAGSATVFTVTTNRVYVGLTDGIRLVVRFHADSGLAPTLTVDSNAAVPLQSQVGIAVPVGMIKAGTPIALTYVNSANAFIVNGIVVTDVDFFPGDFKHSMQTADHGKWLLADGRAVNRVGTHAALFAVVGVKHGAGNGSTTFNILDGRGRVLVGADNMGGSAANRVTTAGSGIDGLTLGVVGGQQNVQLTTGQLPVHSHSVINFVDPGHGHVLGAGGMVRLNASGNLNLTVGTSGDGAGSLSNNTTGITFGIGDAGSDQSHTNMQPVVIVNTFQRF